AGSWSFFFVRRRAVDPRRAVMGQVDQVEAMAPRPVHGQCGGRGQAHQGADAGTYRLVQQFQAAAAGDQGEATVSVDTFAGDGADQLVQGVMATDVFTAQTNLAAGVDEQGGMQRAAVACQLLLLTDALAQASQVFQRWQCCAAQG